MIKNSIPAIRLFDMSLRGQIGQKDKNILCRQLGYFDICILRGQLGQNDKEDCRQLGYFCIIIHAVM